MANDSEDFGRAIITPEQLSAWFRRFRGAADRDEQSPRTPDHPSNGEANPAAQGESPPPSTAASSTRPAPPLPPTGPRRFALGKQVLRLHSVVATLVLVAAVWASSGFYKVDPDQVGLVMRFGRFDGTRGPGLHYHLPYPVESVLLPRVTAVNELKINNGAVTQMLTGDENIVEATAAVSWRISDPVKFMFDVYDPEATVRVAAESAVRQVIALNPIQSGLSDQRQKIADDVQTLLQSMLDFYGAGIQITQVQLQRVDPPGAVIDAFNDVQRARADQQRTRNEAEAYRNDILPRARGEAERLKQEAQGYQEQAINQAQAAAARFLAMDAAYQQSRDITARRLYLDTMEDVLKSSGKVVICPTGCSGTSIIPVMPLTGAAVGTPAIVQKVGP